MHLDLDELAITLLEQATLDPNGVIMKTLTFGGTGFTTNGKDQNTEHTPRSTAALDEALHQLWKNNLVSRNQSADIYTVTKLGFDYIEALPK